MLASPWSRPHKAHQLRSHAPLHSGSDGSPFTPPNNINTPCTPHLLTPPRFPSVSMNHIALSIGHVDCLAYLCDNGMDVNAMILQLAPIAIAASRGELKWPLYSTLINQRDTHTHTHSLSSLFLDRACELCAVSGRAWS